MSVTATWFGTMRRAADDHFARPMEDRRTASPSAVSADVKFPDWIDQEPVEQRSEQLFGAPASRAALDPSRPVEEQLLELYQSSHRREVKSLVARSSVYVGLFVPFVEALRDSDQKSSWKTHIDTLRSAMSLGPESAEKIYQTLDDQRGEAAAARPLPDALRLRSEQIGTARGRRPASPRSLSIGWRTTASTTACWRCRTWRNHRHAADAQSGRHADRARPRHPPLAAAAQSGRVSQRHGDGVATVACGNLLPAASR